MEIEKCNNCGYSMHDEVITKCKCGNIIKKYPILYNSIYWIFLVGHLSTFGIAIWFFIDLRIKEGVVEFPYATIIGFIPISIALYYYFRHSMYGALKILNTTAFIIMEVIVLVILKSMIILLLSKYYDFF